MDNKKRLGGRIMQNKAVAKLGELSFLYHQKLVLLFLFLLIVALFFCLLSYDVADPAWSHVSSHTNTTPTNVFGRTGALLADLLYTFLGWSAWLLLGWLALEAAFIQSDKRYVLPLRLFAYTFLQVCVAVLLTAFFAGGGVIGAEAAGALRGLLGTWGMLGFALAFVLGVGFLLVSPLLTKTPTPKPKPLTKKRRLPSSPAPTIPEQPSVPAKSNPTAIRPTGVLAQFLASSGLSGELETNPSTAQDKSDAAANDSEPTVRPSAVPKPSQDMPHQASATPSQPSPSHTQTTPNLSQETLSQETLSQAQQQKPSDTPSDQTAPHHTTNQPPAGDADHVLAGFHIDTAWQAQGKPMNTKADNAQTDNEQISHQDDKQTADYPIKHEQVANAPTPAFDTPSDNTTPQADQAVDTPSFALTAEQNNSAQSQPSDPINPNTNANSVSGDLDIHDDERFARQSYAMASATHRASLSPLPSLDLLDPSTTEDFGYSSDELAELAERLQIKLKEFNINGTVQNIIQGPIVTSFEVELAAGVRASRVTTITTDLARSLAVEGLRVVEVIPGKPYIGIEISNKSKQTIKLIDLLVSSDYQSDDKTIAMAVGKGVAGEPVIADLAKAPHMLVAGTTGSGKSVLVNSLILSMLLKYRPEELRLVIIDPKEVDFAFYADIPHLLTPIVTDIETDTLPVLSWCVAEMERRYQLMKALRVQKLTELNAKIHQANAQGAPLIDPLWRPDEHASTTPPKLAPLPFIVIIADEYNDVVKQVGKPLEDAVVRIAQKARAAGIHVIIATQRPSVDVITGIIKSNIPSRVAMYLKNKVDSRTVIDTGGAETLLGNGDMLFVAPGSNQISRVHGAFVSQGEITRIAEAWRQRGDPDYVDLSQDNGEGYIQSDDTADPLYQEAVAFVVDSGKTSISAIQRKLSIGYNRAANIVDDMQARGILSPPDNSGKRTLLL